MISRLLMITIISLITSQFNPVSAFAKNDLTPAEITEISKQAYIYGYPIVDSYRIQYAYFVDKTNSEFKAPWNHIKNIPHVYTPADKAVQTPNSDTPYSVLGADLRSEPLVLTVPAIEKNRYYSIQFVDLYTFNFAYLGSRTTGNGGGKYLLAGPNWDGDKPDGIDSIIQSETEYVLVVYRTQLFNPSDLDNVKKIQNGYKVQPVSEYLGMKSPAAPAINFIKPLTPQEERTSVEFFNILNFILQFCPTNPSENDLMKTFALIGVGAGRRIDKSTISPEIRNAMEAGIADAWNSLDELRKSHINTGKLNSGDLFGTRDYLKNNYLYRMAAAVLGIFGNSRQEAMYPIYLVDSEGHALNGSQNRYTLHFSPGQLPPVYAFWSLTMYELPSNLLVENPINRYIINSPMLPDLKRDKDGGLTLYIQHESPGKEYESNWLPAPDKPFMSVLRLYWPGKTALDGTWKNPPMIKVK